MPRALVVLGVRVPLVPARHGSKILAEGERGRYDPSSGTIYYRAELNPLLLAMTLRHEVLHVINDRLMLGLTHEQIAGLGTALGSASEER
jgi:hypothetical protein